MPARRTEPSHSDSDDPRRRPAPWGLFEAALWPLQQAQVHCAALMAPQLPADALARLRDARLRRLLEHARLHSRLHARRLPALSAFSPIDLQSLPVLSRAELMADFEASLCDAGLDADTVESWLLQPERVGELIDGRWQVWESSGTHGQPGWFVQDRAALGVYDALESLRGAGSGAWSTLAAGGRMALLVATGGHFASIASFERLRRAQPWLSGSLRAFSILDPLPPLVHSLNSWRPQVLATYPTAAAVLAEEQRRGRLRLQLDALWCGGETLSPGLRAEIEAAFGCPVRNSYGASEFFCIASECREGGLHLNADWLILEPVDAQLQPVADGEWPQTCLLTNLANLAQPLIRYELGDRVRYTGEACACGSRLPLIEVRGREDPCLDLVDARGETQRVLPLALSTVIEDVAGVYDYQLVQTTPSALSLRCTSAADAHVQAAVDALRQWLRQRDLGGVEVTAEPGCRLTQGRSGKLSRILALHEADPHPPRKHEADNGPRGRQRRPR
jgi:phenylacetate-CoA ligase